MTATGGDFGLVAIGRNEGARLVACLRSAEGHAPRVYVDSGSSDGSAAAAEGLGAEVVELDLSTPFTAARARNAGFAALVRADPGVALVQFVDGDCEMSPGWREAAAEALAADPTLGAVCGWLTEKRRGASVYNMMCDVEWHGPTGDIAACGGIMAVRREAFEAVGGFDPGIVAAEDDDFCVRLREAGWKVRRIPREMARHDAAMTSFGQWWRRAVRAGHAFAQVGARHPGHFDASLRRIWIWGAALPAAALAGGLLVSPWIAVAVAGLYALSFLKTAAGLLRRPLPPREAAICAAFLTLSKFPGLQGLLTYRLRRLRGGELRLIEHK